MFSEWVQNVIRAIGYWGVLLLTTLENLFPPIPSEVILTFAGFVTSQTADMSIILMILAATAGSLIGAVILYFIGRLIGLRRLERLVLRYGKYVGLKVSDVQKATAFYEKYENRAVFFCRFVPVVRSLISIPAGLAKMSMTSFLLLTTAGTLIWNTALCLAGMIVGDNWNVIVGFMGKYSTVAYVLLGLLVAAFLVWFYLRRRPQSSSIKSWYAKKHSLSAGSDFMREWERIENRLKSAGAGKMTALLENFYVYHTASFPKKALNIEYKRLDLPPEELIEKLSRFAEGHASFFRAGDTDINMLRYLPFNYWQVILGGALFENYRGYADLKNRLNIFFYKVWTSGRSFTEYETAVCEAVNAVKAGVTSDGVMRLLAEICADTEFAADINAALGKKFVHESWVKPVLIWRQYYLPQTEPRFVPDIKIDKAAVAADPGGMRSALSALLKLELGAAAVFEDY